MNSRDQAKSERTLARHDSQSGIDATRFAERALALCRDVNYQKDVTSQLRRGGWAILLGVIGVAVSLWQLRFGVALSEQAAQFWLLCLVLAGGLTGVAFLVAAGSLAEQFAATRMAIVRKENDEFEAVEESAELFGYLQTTYTLWQGARMQKGSAEDAVLGSTLRFIIDQHQGGAVFTSAEREAIWREIEMGWSTLGVNKEQLQSLKDRRKWSPARGRNRLKETIG
jgi:hypothetical protein